MFGAQPPSSTLQAGKVQDNCEALLSFRDPDHPFLLEQGEGTFDMPNQSGGKQFNVLVNGQGSAIKDALWEGLEDSNLSANRSELGIKDCLLDDDSSDESHLPGIPVTETSPQDDRVDS